VVKTHLFDQHGPLSKLYQVSAELAAFIAMHQETRDVHVHAQLQNDLVDYLGERRG
jgi:hypothetical protein